MRTSDFNYDLPSKFIARFPAHPRDSARLLVLERSTGKILHKRFRDLPQFLQAGDRLIVNDTKVLPARLFCRKTTGAKIELLFIKSHDERVWRVMANPGRRLKVCSQLTVKDNKSIVFNIKEICDNGDRIVELSRHSRFNSVSEVMNKYGHTPLPPYIKRPDRRSDRTHYQTVYASEPGSVAAPTAGLHFTERLLRRIREKGVSVSSVTLHVGPGTFTPVKAVDPREHRMHTESYELTPEVASQIEATAKAGRRNIAVGTTVVRVLEHCCGHGMPPKFGRGETDLMILPGYRFRAVDALITNFHLPCSTLLMLVCAFGGREQVLAAYEEAKREKYRFYSYGDAMLII